MKTYIFALEIFAACLLALHSSVRADVVINEIHYDPVDKTQFVEFIELFHSGDSAMDLTGWKLSGGIDFAIPDGTTLESESFLVIAQSPEKLLEVFGRQALGPWTGSLNNGGEKITLENASGEVADVVDYRSGYPWPSAARGGGSSMELVHPALDNDLSGSWRSSRPPGALAELVYIPGSADGWTFKKGTEEASDPIDAWRNVDFDASSWEKSKLPLGFGGVGSPRVEWATELTDMQGNYSSVFLRRPFEVAVGEIPSKLNLGIINDDGVIVWVNGTEIFRQNVDGEPAFDGTSSGAGQESSELVFEEVEGVAGAFVEGTNVIALQVFNNSNGGSDFGIDLEFVRAADDGGSPDPTPGRANSVFADNLPPQTRQVNHVPQEPKGGEDVTVSVKATDADGITSLSLSYQMVEPGGYVRRTDDAYETGWETIAMTPVDGQPDNYAGTIPADVQQHRRLIRYRITATDGAGLSVQVPYDDDEQPNFCYFVYDGAPDWTAADQPGTTENVTFPKSALEHLPIYHLIANESDVSRSQYTSSFEGRHFFGTLVYDGTVYDHIEFSNRGEFSTYQSGKNKWRFHFTRTHDLVARDNYGKKYKSNVKTMNLNACASPWVPANRGMAGMEEALGFRMYQLAGTPSPNTHWLHFRVIDEEEEAPVDDQYAGDVWGLYLYVEHPDSRFLGARNLEDGNTYKIESGNGDKKNQGPTQETSTRDWTSFRNDSRRAQDTEWWKENFDLDAYYGFRAMNRAVGNIDIREGWNHYFYHNPDGRWAPIVWDLDMLLMPETHWSGTIDQKICLRNDDIEIAFQNHCRKLVDLLLSDKGDFGGQVAQLVEELATVVNPPELELTMVDIDQFMWNNNRRSSGGHRGAFYDTPKNQNFRGGTLRRVLATPDHEGYEQYLKNFTTDTDTDGWRLGDGDQNGYGFEYLSDEAEDADIPETPTIQYTGPMPLEFPVDQLTWDSSAFADPNGAESFGAREWRIGRVYNPQTPDYEAGKAWKYEVETVWESGPLADAAITGIQIPLQVVQAGATYRVRVRFLDNSGRASHWSEATQFVASAPNVSEFAGLKVSEIMYFPVEATEAERAAGFTTSDMEYLELHNTGATPIDLGKLILTQGVDYDFAGGEIKMLAPGAYVLIVSNKLAFESRYGPSSAITGEWGNDKLSNSGETIAISLGQGNDVLSFTYDITDPWPIATRGQSLAFSGDVLAEATSWALAAPSPGKATDDGGDTGYSTWAVTHFGAADVPEAAPAFDADFDGFVNAIEFALASAPTQRGSVPTIEPVVIEGSPAIRFLRRINLDDYTVTLQQSTDLSSWSDAAVVEVSSTAVDADTVQKTWRSSTPIGSSVFLRLEIVQPTE
ncbi:MAG: hypothetical protein ACI9R3_001366 [Verrucomicrobiales bacterium]|jgi:hypothetical protein